MTFVCAGVNMGMLLEKKNQQDAKVSSRLLPAQCE